MMKTTWRQEKINIVYHGKFVLNVIKRSCKLTAFCEILGGGQHFFIFYINLLNLYLLYGFREGLKNWAGKDPYYDVLQLNYSASAFIFPLWLVSSLSS